MRSSTSSGSRRPSARGWDGGAADESHRPFVRVSSRSRESATRFAQHARDAFNAPRSRRPWSRSTSDARTRYVRRCGRSGHDHQRKEAESQVRLNSLAEKLRQERGRLMQLQRHNQELSFSAAPPCARGATGAPSSALSRGGVGGAVADAAAHADQRHRPAERARSWRMFRGAPPSSSAPAIFGSTAPRDGSRRGLPRRQRQPSRAGPRGARGWWGSEWEDASGGRISRIRVHLVSAVW